MITGSDGMIVGKDRSYGRGAFLYTSIRPIYVSVMHGLILMHNGCITQVQQRYIGAGMMGWRGIWHLPNMIVHNYNSRLPYGTVITLLFYILPLTRDGHVNLPRIMVASIYQHFL